jgi:hypothetical protein
LKPLNNREILFYCALWAAAFAVYISFILSIYIFGTSVFSIDTFGRLTVTFILINIYGALELYVYSRRELGFLQFCFRIFYNINQGRDWRE